MQSVQNINANEKNLFLELQPGGEKKLSCLMMGERGKGGLIEFLNCSCSMGLSDSRLESCETMKKF